MPFFALLTLVDFFCRFSHYPWPTRPILRNPLRRLVPVIPFPQEAWIHLKFLPLLLLLLPLSRQYSKLARVDRRETQPPHP